MSKSQNDINNGLHLKIGSGIQKLYINISLYLHISIKYNNGYLWMV